MKFLYAAAVLVIAAKNAEASGTKWGASVYRAPVIADCAAATVTGVDYTEASLNQIPQGNGDHGGLCLNNKFPVSLHDAASGDAVSGINHQSGHHKPALSAACASTSVNQNLLHCVPNGGLRKIVFSEDESGLHGVWSSSITEFKYDAMIQPPVDLEAFIVGSVADCWNTVDGGTKDSTDRKVEIHTWGMVDANAAALVGTTGFQYAQTSESFGSWAPTTACATEQYYGISDPTSLAQEDDMTSDQFAHIVTDGKMWFNAAQYAAGKCNCHDFTKITSDVPSGCNMGGLDGSGGAGDLTEDQAKCFAPGVTDFTGAEAATTGFGADAGFVAARRGLYINLCMNNQAAITGAIYAPDGICMPMACEAHQSIASCKADGLCQVGSTAKADDTEFTAVTEWATGKEPEIGELPWIAVDAAATAYDQRTSYEKLLTDKLPGQQYGKFMKQTVGAATVITSYASTGRTDGTLFGTTEKVMCMGKYPEAKTETNYLHGWKGTGWCDNYFDGETCLREDKHNLIGSFQTTPRNEMAKITGGSATNFAMHLARAIDPEMKCAWTNGKCHDVCYQLTEVDPRMGDGHAVSGGTTEISTGEAFDMSQSGYFVAGGTKEMRMRHGTKVLGKRCEIIPRGTGSVIGTTNYELADKVDRYNSYRYCYTFEDATMNLGSDEDGATDITEEGTTTKISCAPKGVNYGRTNTFTNTLPMNTHTYTYAMTFTATQYETHTVTPAMNTLTVTLDGGDVTVVPPVNETNGTVVEPLKPAEQVWNALISWDLLEDDFLTKTTLDCLGKAFGYDDEASTTAAFTALDTNTDEKLSKEEFMKAEIEDSVDILQLTEETKELLTGCGGTEPPTDVPTDSAAIGGQSLAAFVAAATAALMLVVA